MACGPPRFSIIDHRSSIIDHRRNVIAAPSPAPQPTRRRGDPSAALPTAVLSRRSHHRRRRQFGGRPANSNLKGGKAIPRFPTSQQLAQSLFQVGPAEQRTRLVAAQPVSSIGWISRHINDQGAEFGGGKVSRLGGPPRTSSDHLGRLVERYGHRALFEHAESGFAVGGENRRDAATGAGLDPRVEVAARRVEHAGHNPGNGGLSGPRKANQEDMSTGQSSGSGGTSRRAVQR